MDYKIILDRIDWNEKRINEAKKNLSELRDIVSTFSLSHDVGEMADMMRMFDEKFRIEYALKITKNNRRAADLLKMTERSLYRKIKKYNLVK